MVEIGILPPPPPPSLSLAEGQRACDIHILGRESAKSSRRLKRGRVAGGRGEWEERRMAEVGGGWQSVEASGADQWPDGGNSGILTPYTAKGVSLSLCAVAADAAARLQVRTVCDAGCAQRQRMSVTRA